MAGIEGRYTNRSLRATTATRGLVNVIPEKIVIDGKNGPSGCEVTAEIPEAGCGKEDWIY